MFNPAAFPGGQSDVAYGDAPPGFPDPGMGGLPMRPSPVSTPMPMNGMTPMPMMAALPDLREARFRSPANSGFASLSGITVPGGMLANMATNLLTQQVFGPNIAPITGTDMSPGGFLRARERSAELMNHQSDLMASNPGLKKYGEQGNSKAFQYLYDTMLSPGGSTAGAMGETMSRMGSTVFREDSTAIQIEKSKDVVKQIREENTRKDGTFDLDKTGGRTISDQVRALDVGLRYNLGDMTEESIEKDRKSGNVAKTAARASKMLDTGKEIFGKGKSDEETAQLMTRTFEGIEKLSEGDANQALNKFKATSNVLNIDQKALAAYVDMMKQVYKNAGVVGPSATSAALGSLENLKATQRSAGENGYKLNQDEAMQAQIQIDAEWKDSNDARLVKTVMAKAGKLSAEKTSSIMVKDQEGNDLSLAEAQKKIAAAVASGDTDTAIGLSTSVADSSKDASFNSAGIYRSRDNYDTKMENDASKVMDTAKFNKAAGSAKEAKKLIIEGVEDNQFGDTAGEAIKQRLKSKGGLTAVLSGAHEHDLDSYDTAKKFLKGKQEKMGLSDSDVEEMANRLPAGYTEERSEVQRNSLIGAEVVGQAFEITAAQEDGTTAKMDRATERSMHEDGILRGIAGNSLNEKGSSSVQAGVDSIFQDLYQKKGLRGKEFLEEAKKSAKAAGVDFLGVKRLESMFKIRSGETKDDEGQTLDEVTAKGADLQKAMEEQSDGTEKGMAAAKQARIDFVTKKTEEFKRNSGITDDEVDPTAGAVPDDFSSATSSAKALEEASKEKGFNAEKANKVLEEGQRQGRPVTKDDLLKGEIHKETTEEKAARAKRQDLTPGEMDRVDKATEAQAAKKSEDAAPKDGKGAEHAGEPPGKGVESEIVRLLQQIVDFIRNFRTAGPSAINKGP